MEIKIGRTKIIVNLKEGKVFTYYDGELYERTVFNSNEKIILHLQDMIRSLYTIEIQRLLEDFKTKKD